MTPEIRAFEYALGLYAVLIGLAVADIANSLHRLIRRASTVRWDPLTLLAAAYAFCIAVGMWFDLWGVRNVAATRHFFFYFSLVAEFVVLFLIAAASLPDEPGDGDLRTYYGVNQRYYWSLVAVFQLSYFLNGLYFTGSMIARAGRAGVPLVLEMGLPFLVALVLVFVRRRAVHYAGVTLLLALTASHYARYQIN